LLPYDPIKKELILIQQFRAGVLSRYDEDYLLEIVAGIIDEGENPEETAIRECFEETGCEVKKIYPIQSYFPAPGSSESYYHLYLGEIQAFDGERIKGLEKENEDILVKSFKIDEVRQMLKEKKIMNGLTLIALQWFFLEYYKG
jgi:ADP-ribose pyrophosphatase